MTKTHELDYCRKRRQAPLAMKCGFGALTSLLAFAAPASADVVGLTLQKMDISVQPVDPPFSVTLSIQKDQNGNVTVDIPSITQTFFSSQDSPNVDASKQFPAFWQPTPSGDGPSSNTCPPLPANYPLGGYVDTVADNIPVEFRPASGLPVTFTVGSAVTPGLTYTGYIDNQGRLQFSASENVPVDVGTFATLPARVTYNVGNLPSVAISNFQISRGASNAAKWNPQDFPNPPHTPPDDTVGGYTAIHFDFGDFNDPQEGFYNGTFYTTWADNSAELPGNTPDQAYKSYALAKIKVDNFGKNFKVERVVNLSRTLAQNFSYAEGGVAVDPANEMNVVVASQQRKMSRNGFVLYRSFNGGKIWTKKILGLADPNNPDQPLDPNVPIGGSDNHQRFDCFGGLWIIYLSGEAEEETGSGMSVPYIPFTAPTKAKRSLLSTLKMLWTKIRCPMLLSPITLGLIMIISA